MHVNRLHCHQGTKRGCILNYYLSQEPGIHEGVVRVNEYALAAIPLAPTGDLSDVPKEIFSCNRIGLRASREYLKGGFWSLDRGDSRRSLCVHSRVPSAFFSLFFMAEILSLSPS